MIVEEILSDHPGLIKRYSNSGFLIRQDQTGIEYSEAIDSIASPYTYTETTDPINPPIPDDPEPVDPEPVDPEPDEPDPEPILSAEEALEILLGGELE